MSSAGPAAAQRAAGVPGEGLRSDRAPKLPKLLLRTVVTVVAVQARTQRLAHPAANHRVRSGVRGEAAEPAPRAPRVEAPRAAKAAKASAGNGEAQLPPAGAPLGSYGGAFADIALARPGPIAPGAAPTLLLVGPLSSCGRDFCCLCAGVSPQRVVCWPGRRARRPHFCSHVHWRTVAPRVMQSHNP